MKNLITKRKKILRKIVGKVRKGFDKGKKYGLAGLVGLGMLAYTNNANALEEGDPGYAYTTNWWDRVKEEPNTAPKNLMVDAYIEYPFETDGHDLRIGFFLDHNNQFVGKSGQYPDSIGETNGNALLFYDNIGLSGDYEGTNRTFKAKIHWQDGNIGRGYGPHLDVIVEKVDTNDYPWKISWRWSNSGKEWNVSPLSATVKGTVIPEPVGIYVAGLWGLYALRRKKE